MNCVREEVSQARVNVWGEVRVPVVGADVRVKFEINCADLPPLFDVARRSHEVATRVWNESANIPTFQSPELLGTKFRALAQRRKGRDLSDLWLARSEMAIADEDLASAADYYLSAADITPTQFRERLAQHVLDPEFRHDLDALTNTPYAGFDPAQAARELIQWTDLHLDPLRDQRRSRNAVRRDQQRWEREGWAPGNLRCPEYTMGDGNLRRCPRWVEPGEACPVHG